MSTTETLFSIVTVVLNDREGLIRTEESILRQTCCEYEWVVVDGGSKDGSAEVPRNSKIKRVRWISGPDHGIYDAMNKGIGLSAGKYVQFLNAGDELSGEGVLESIAEVTTGLSPTPVVMGGVNLVLSHGGMVSRLPRKIEYIWHSLPTSHQAMFFPLNYLKLNMYDISYQICGDYYLGALAYKLGRQFVTINSPVVNFEVGGFSYQRPWKLACEAMRIQRTILGIGRPRLYLSVLYRMTNTLGLRTLRNISTVLRIKR